MDNKRILIDYKEYLELIKTIDYFKTKFNKDEALNKIMAKNELLEKSNAELKKQLELALKKKSFFTFWK